MGDRQNNTDASFRRGVASRKRVPDRALRPASAKPMLDKFGKPARREHRLKISRKRRVRRPLTTGRHVRGYENHSGGFGRFHSWNHTGVGAVLGEHEGSVSSDRQYLRGEIRAIAREDRKSTRLNSSHVSISYAVFCLKKKKTTRKM